MLNSFLDKLTIATAGSALSCLVLLQGLPAKAASFSFKQQGYENPLVPSETGIIVGNFTGEDLDEDGKILGGNFNNQFSNEDAKSLLPLLNLVFPEQDLKKILFSDTQEVNDFSATFTSNNSQDSFTLGGAKDFSLFAYDIKSQQLSFYSQDYDAAHGIGVSTAPAGAVAEGLGLNPLQSPTISVSNLSVQAIAQYASQIGYKTYATDQPVQVIETSGVTRQSVPEPNGHTALLVMGLGGLGFLLKKNRASTPVN